MIRRKVDSKLERQILVALITNKQFLASAAPLLTDLRLFEQKFVRQIAGWCLTHFKQYQSAPAKGIRAIYSSWAETQYPSEDDADAVRDFLESISEQYDTDPQINVSHLVDETSNFLTTKKLARLRDEIDTSLMHGRREDALAAVQGFRTVTNSDGMGFAPIRNKEAVCKTYAERQKPLLAFGEQAGKFFNNGMMPEGLIGIMGPEKRGKTYWCLEFIYRAIRSRKRVAMFEVGDLTEVELKMRLDSRIARLPFWVSEAKGGIQVPKNLHWEKGGEGKRVEVDFDTEVFPTCLHDGPMETVWKAHKEFCRLYKITGNEVRFSVHPNSSINVAGIDRILQRWKYELEWVPDVIIIDYPDILLPEEGNRDFRHQVNDTWKAMRRLGQEWHALVIAPTQSDAASYEVKTLTAKNFSEDKRKLAHITGMIGLNQTQKEKEKQIIRLNWIRLRGAPFNEYRCLFVSQCLPLGMAMCQAIW